MQYQQYQDILTIAIIALPTAFAALMLVDFLALTRKLIQQQRWQAIALTTLQEPITLDDPWTLPIDELPICSTTHYPLPTLPTLLLLPPGKEHSKPPKRSKKTTAPSTDTPKRRGRPPKAA